MKPRIWLLLAPNPPVICLQLRDEKVFVDLTSRSVDSLDLVSRISVSRKSEKIGPEEWKSVKKGVTKIFSRIKNLEGVKAQFGFRTEDLAWQLLFNFSRNTVSFQPWVEVDFWLLAEVVDSVGNKSIDSRSSAVSVSSLSKFIDDVPKEKLDQDLKIASSLWPETRELAFQFIEEKAAPVITTFVDYVTQSLVSKPSRRFEPGEFPAWFIWNPAAIADLRYRNERIIENIIDHKPISLAQKYCSLEGTNAWLTRADISVNPRQAIAVAHLESLVGEIAEIMQGEQLINVLSLGTGDGIKDAKIIRSLVEANKQDVAYYPVDISPVMLGMAITQVMRESPRIGINGVIADFTSKVARIRELILAEGSVRPTLVSLLGNALGNIDNDWSFVCQLGKVLVENDVLLLEVRRAESIEDSLEDFQSLSPARKKFFLEPLAAIGAKYSHENLFGEVQSDNSLSTTIKVYCRDVEHERFRSRKVDLFTIKHYKDAFFSEVAQEIDAEIHLRSISDRSLREIAMFLKK